jgi:hypothetical protein
LAAGKNFGETVAQTMSREALIHMKQFKEPARNCTYPASSEGRKALVCSILNPTLVLSMVRRVCEKMPHIGAMMRCDCLRLNCPSHPFLYNATASVILPKFSEIIVRLRDVIEGERELFARLERSIDASRNKSLKELTNASDWERKAPFPPGPAG